MLVRNLCVLALLAAVAVNAIAAEGVKLNGIELAKRVSKYEAMAGTSYLAEEVNWMVVAYANGTRELYWNNGVRSGTDTGTHRVVGDQLCVTWKKALYGEERCYDIYRIDADPVRYQSFRNGELVDLYYKIR